MSGNGFAGLDLNNLYVAILAGNTYSKMDYGIFGVSTNLFTSYDEFGNLNNVGIRMVDNGHLLYQVGKGKTRPVTVAASSRGGAVKGTKISPTRLARK